MSDECVYCGGERYLGLLKSPCFMCNKEHDQMPRSGKKLKLSYDNVIEIKELRSQKWTLRKLAKKFNVSEVYIWFIVNGMSRKSS